MKIYFLDNKDIHEIKTILNDLYTNTIDIFEKKFNSYNEQNNNLSKKINSLSNKMSILSTKVIVVPVNAIGKNEIDEIEYNELMMEDLMIMIKQLKDHEFKQIFLEWELEILEKVRYASVKYTSESHNDNISFHTDKCVIRAVFDILFKYCFDFEYKVPHLCCNNTRFKIMQFEILRDLRWILRPDPSYVKILSKNFR
jgi:hypothetical protein